MGCASICPVTQPVPLPEVPHAVSRPPWSKRSLAAQAMGHVDPITKAVVPPIHVATTYIRDEDNAYSSGFVYGRPDNATVREAEGVIAMLEEAQAGALLFSSGMAAATAVFQALDPGDHVVALEGHVLGAAQLAHDGGDALGPRGRFRRDRRPRRPARAPSCPGATKLVWIETPSNPLWTITDIAGAAEIAHAAGARLAVDSTCASPDPHPAAGARRRHRHACGDQGAERPFGRGRRRARGRQGGRVLGADRHDPQEAGRDPRALRGLSADARHAHPSPARRRPGQERHGAGASASRPIPRSPACSIPACRSIPATTSPRGRWRAASATCCRSRSPAARPPPSRTAARVGLWKRATSLGRRREPHRAPRLDRGAGHALPAGPAAPVDRHRGPGGPFPRPRRGAAPPTERGVLMLTS